MICPSCKNDMIVVEHDRIELDYCTNCEGVWFDSGELELLLQSLKLESPDLVVEHIIRLPERKPLHKQRKCPICTRKMKEIGIGQPEIPIDVCRRGDGLWLDGGELHQLLIQLAQKTLAGGSPEQQIATFLGEVFKVD